MEPHREGDKPAIKVVDRRRFTAEGSVRPEAGPLSDSPRRTETVLAAPPAATGRPPASGGRAATAASKRGQAAAQGRRDAPTGAPQPEAEPDEPRLEFLPFVATLATNAMAALGMLPDAERQGIPRSPQMAREYIDILAMLEQRTRGNLTDEEAQTMARLLNDLRVQYVELTRSVQPAHMAPPNLR